MRHATRWLGIPALLAALAFPHAAFAGDAATPDDARPRARDAGIVVGTLPTGPRNAIVECWLRLERAVADAGIRHDPADTSTDLTVRVLTRMHVDQDAIERLGALYREARFSEHPMGEPARAAAIDALDAIHRNLRAHADRVGVPA